MSANKLAVSGLQKFSTCDWEGNMVATVFTQGCPLNCSYCHNPSLIPTVDGTIHWQEVEAFLLSRKGLLDGVVFSGGEPTRQTSIVDAARVVREMGYKIGFHTMGIYPSRISALLEEGLVNWFGFDIKADWAQYPSVTLVNSSSQSSKAQRSLLSILSSGLDYEVRTTVHPSLFSSEHIDSIASNLSELGVKEWVVQKARSEGALLQWGEVWGTTEGDEFLSAIRTSCEQHGISLNIR